MPSKNTIKRRQQLAKGKKASILELCSPLGILVTEINHYQLRLSKDDKSSIDVYPNSMKTFDLKTKKWDENKTLEELEEKIANNFI